MKKQWNIGIALQMWTRQGQTATSGIVDYANTHPGFLFRDVVFAKDEEVPSKLARLRCDGAIINLTKIVFDKIASELPKIPLVNIGAVPLAPSISSVTSPRGSGSRLLLSHLRGLGFQRFAYVGPEPTDSIGPSAAILRDLLSAREGPLGLFSLPGPGPIAPSSLRVRKMSKWLAQFHRDPRRTGILTYDGHRATAVIATCKKLGLAVPDQVGVASYIDEQACLTAAVPVTSVEPPGHEIGFAAMKLLYDRLRRPRARTIRLEVGMPTLHIRASTTIANEEKCEITEAVRFMGKNLEKNLTMDDVVRHLETMSRATFYRTFSQQTGKHPSEYLRSLRLDRAKELLTETNLSITRIARMCGFASLTQFGDTFRRAAGKTPRQFRKKGGSGRRPRTSRKRNTRLQRA